jgi:preprotein translocase subunit SecG
LLVYLLYTIFFLSCVVLIGSVLLQPGKTDAGALFTSNVSSTAFGPRGTATVLSKLTIISATVFMLSALVISMPSITGSRSVLQTAGDAPVETAPQNPAQPTGDSQAPITEQPVPGTAPANTSASNTGEANSAEGNSPNTNAAAPASNR